LSADKKEFAVYFERMFGKQLQLRLQILNDFKELTA
jgi:hypothetical protein